jgi:hypothetical protein
MGWIVGDEVRQPFAACLMVSPRTGDADRVVIAPQAELSTALRRQRQSYLASLGAA